MPMPKPALVAPPESARPRRAICLLLATALIALGTGCEFSRVNPQAAIHISGRALDASGAPLAGATVRLFKDADIGEALIGVVLAIGTLGAVCLLANAPAICRQARTATTGRDGWYAFDLKGSDTQGLIGTLSTLDVVVADPGGGDHGASTTISFKARTANLALPDARLWDAAASLSQGHGHLRLAWSALPAANGQVASYSAQLLDPVRHGVLWSQPASGTSADIDARVIEDVHASAAVQALATLAGNGFDVRAAYLSRRLEVNPVAGPPPSRHQPCSAVVASVLTSVPQAACGVTDGELVTPARLSAPRAQVVSGAVVDLGAPRPIGLVVARGLAAMFVVEVSADGLTYQEIGTGTATAAVMPIPGRPAVRYVRVRSPGGLDESLMSEISVW